MRRVDRMSDGELLAGASRDPRMFAAFYRRHERVVLGFLRSRTTRGEVAADLAAETFVIVLERADRFDAGRAPGGSAVPWLVTIARNTLLTSIRRGVVAEDARRRMHCPVTELDDAAIRRVDELVSADGRPLAALSELPEDLRIAVTARVIEERDYPDIAAELACSELVVRKRVSRGLARMRAELTT